jgi:hypothetical protein
MTKEEASLVLQSFRDGRQFSYGSYTAGVRYTFFFDQEKNSFAVREQDAYSNAEDISQLTEEEMSQRLQNGFRYEEVI